MSEVKKCPKCGNEMIQIDKLSDGHGGVQLYTGFFSSIGKVVPFCCQNCGYIELYNEKNIKKE